MGKIIKHFLIGGLWFARSLVSGNLYNFRFQVRKCINKSKSIFLEWVILSADIGTIAFERVLGKTAQREHFSVRIKIFVHNETS